MKTLEDIADFHGHTCPGLAIGYRVSRYALRALGERSEDEELVAVVENDSCAVDAVQVMTGCTFGKGNLIFHDYGKQVYTFIRRPSREALRIAVTWVSPEEGEEEKDAWLGYSKGDRSEPVLKLVRQRKSRKIKAILDAPDETLFTITREPVAEPDRARIYPSVTCVACGEKVMEPRARLLRGKAVCIPCFEKENAA